MHCTNCGNELHANTHFCRFCGCKVQQPVFTAETKRKSNNVKSALLITCVVVICAVLICGLLYLKFSKPTDGEPAEEVKTETQAETKEETKAETKEETKEETTHSAAEETPAEETGTEIAVVDGVYEEIDGRVFRIPQVEIDGIPVDSINEEIYEAMYPALEETRVIVKEGGSAYISGMNYSCVGNGDVISILAWVGPYPGDWISYYSWNLSATTGELLTIGEFTEALGMTESEFIARAKCLMVENVMYYDGMPSDMYHDGIMDTMSEEYMERIRPYLNEDGELCFAGLMASFAGGGQYYHLFCLERGEADDSGYQYQPGG